MIGYHLNIYIYLYLYQAEQKDSYFRLFIQIQEDHQDSCCSDYDEYIINIRETIR